MRTRLLIIVLVISLWVGAEPIPAGYYSSLDGLCDSSLLAALSDTVGGGLRFHYGTHGTSYPEGTYYTGTWNYFPYADRKPDGSIWDMYSNSVRYYPQEEGESACSIQIEHCLPKSWWGGEDANKRAYQDLYNLNPSDAQANGQKSNYPPGHVTRGDKFDNGSFRMDSKNKSQYGTICFEPDSAYRGDFARAYFYIVTAYHDTPWNQTYSSYVSNSSYQVFAPWLIQVLLDWHRSDPVDNKERLRQDIISSAQHNRNPYIDYPELIEYIWGNRQGDTVWMDSMVCTYDSTIEPPVYPIEVDSHLYDTLIALPALSKNIINAYPYGFASDKIQSSGTAAITMGSGTTDGYISFSNLALTDSALLVFRASPFKTASSMQLDIYAGDSLVRTITETVVQNTRYQITYTCPIPMGTDSITIKSVGSATTRRACIQNMYLLQRRASGPATGAEEGGMVGRKAHKVYHRGQILIERQQQLYTLNGNRL